MLISSFLYLYHPYSFYSLPHKLMPYLSFLSSVPSLKVALTILIASTFLLSNID